MLEDIATRIARSVRRRPVRVLEAVIGLAATLGYALTPEATGHILALAALVLVGGEVVQQTATTALADPHDVDGTPLVPADAERTLAAAEADGALVADLPVEHGDPEGT